MREAMVAMRQYKAKDCYLEVRVSNSPAMAMYKKLTFEISRTVRGYYADGEDAAIMTRKLAAI
jgi:ribosomal-protein-alanine N-acetyltransferase